MAVQTHETNLKDKLFCELFPGIAEKSRNFLSRAKSLNNRQKNANSSSQGSSEDDPYESSLRQLENNEIQAGQGFYGAVTNFLVIGGFAAFAFVVQYVIQSLTVTDWKNQRKSQNYCEIFMSAFFIQGVPSSFDYGFSEKLWNILKIWINFIPDLAKKKSWNISKN